jgi:Zn-finger nucleic acid-binding protein
MALGRAARRFHYYGRGYDPRYRDKKKRKSFLGDLFDF